MTTLILIAKAPAAVAPSFTATPSIHQIGDGVVEFEVRLTSCPAPTIQWYKGTTPINDGGRYRAVTHTDGTNYILTLTISGVTKEDGGAYKVTAKTAAGESNANINLNLEGLSVNHVANCIIHFVFSRSYCCTQFDGLLASVRENVCNNSKKRKKSCFFDLKNVKSVRRPIVSQPRNYRKSVPVSHGHQHKTSYSEVWTQETMQLRIVCDKRLYAPIISGSFEAKISVDIQQTSYFFVTFYDFLIRHFKKT